MLIRIRGGGGRRRRRRRRGAAWAFEEWRRGGVESFLGILNSKGKGGNVPVKAGE